MRPIKTLLAAFLLLFICSLFHIHAIVNFPEDKLLHVTVPDSLRGGIIRVTKHALYIFENDVVGEVSIARLAKYVASPGTSTLKLVGGEPDITTWNFIFNILQDEQGPDVIFGARTDSSDKLSVQVGDQTPELLFDLSFDGSVSVCLIPGTSYYAIVYLHLLDGEAWLYTNWKNPSQALEPKRNRKLKLKFGDIETFDFLYDIEASHDNLAICFEDATYEIELAKLPDDDNNLFDLKELAPNSMNGFYLSKKKLNFHDVTVTSSLDVKETADIGKRFGYLKIAEGTFYFLTYSTSFLTYSTSFMVLLSQNNDVLIFSVPKEGVKDTITKSSFSLPTHTNVLWGTPYPFVCWSVEEDNMQKIYLFVISNKYTNYSILVLANYLFSPVVST
jgi:hypothetical protein